MNLGAIGEVKDDISRSVEGQQIKGEGLLPKCLIHSVVSVHQDHI